MATPSKRQVLVVDDDPYVRDTVAMSLMAAGYDVTLADDGFSALLQLRKMLPDVMVCDLNMPQMSGYELLSVIRRRFPQITTVAMSGDYQGSTVPPGVIADRFFAKGQSSSGLLALVAILIRTSETWVNSHQKDLAPAWIPRNGNDSRGIPFVTVTCGECLRAFQVKVSEETTGHVLEIPCNFCPGTSSYIIQKAADRMLELSA
jgi:CheY-like chemotaxis protein